MSTVDFSVSLSGTLVLCLYLTTVAFLGWAVTQYMKFEERMNTPVYHFDVYAGGAEEGAEDEDEEEESAEEEGSDEQEEGEPSGDAEEEEEAEEGQTTGEAPKDQ